MPSLEMYSPERTVSFSAVPLPELNFDRSPLPRNMPMLVAFCRLVNVISRWGSSPAVIMSMICSELRLGVDDSSTTGWSAVPVTDIVTSYPKTGDRAVMRSCGVYGFSLVSVTNPWVMRSLANGNSMVPELRVTSPRAMGSRSVL